MIVPGFTGMVFNNFLHLPDLWVKFSVRIHLFGELFWHSRIYGYDFQTFSRFMGILLRNFSGFMDILFFEKFLRIYGGYFYDLNGTNPVSWKLKLPPRDCK